MNKIFCELHIIYNLFLIGYTTNIDQVAKLNIDVCQDDSILFKKTLLIIKQETQIGSIQ